MKVELEFDEETAEFVRGLADEKGLTPSETVHCLLMPLLGKAVEERCERIAQFNKTTRQIELASALGMF